MNFIIVEDTNKNKFIKKLLDECKKIKGKKKIKYSTYTLANNIINYSALIIEVLEYGFDMTF